LQRSLPSRSHELCDTELPLVHMGGMACLTWHFNTCKLSLSFYHFIPCFKQLVLNLVKRAFPHFPG
jgi:hypothetical protein